MSPINLKAKSATNRRVYKKRGDYSKSCESMVALMEGQLLFQKLESLEAIETLKASLNVEAKDYLGMHIDYSDGLIRIFDLNTLRTFNLAEKLPVNELAGAIELAYDNSTVLISTSKGHYKLSAVNASTHFIMED